MADTREKLINELANDIAFHCPDMVENGCVVYNCASCLAERLADDGYHKAVQEWISVKDRLPTREDANETESILAINKDDKYVGRWLWDIVARWPTAFTYWMPLPEPPKGE